MKRWLVYALVLSLFFSFTGCGKEPDNISAIPSSSAESSGTDAEKPLTGESSTTTVTTLAETTVTSTTTTAATTAATTAPSKTMRPKPTAVRPSKVKTTKPAKPTAGNGGSGKHPGDIQANVQTSAGVVTGVYHDAEAKKVLALVNEARKKEGLEELQWSNDFAEATKLRAAEISIKFSHTRPDGSAWNTVHKDIFGENLAKGYGSAEAVFKGWMQSPGHRDNILYPKFKTMNVAFIETNGVQCWAQNFGY